MDKTAATIESYNKNAGLFADKFMNYAPYQRQVAAFAAHLSPNSRVLDLGCGPGNVARQLLSLRPLHLTCVDMSASMLKLAKTHAPAAEFHLHDLRTVTFPANHFDVAILSFCIVHLSDAETEQLIANVNRWLKPEGLLYLSFIEGKPAGFETTSFSSEPLFFNYYDRQNLEQLLQNHGLTVFHQQQYDFPEPDGAFSTELFFFARRTGHK